MVLPPGEPGLSSCRRVARSGTLLGRSCGLASRASPPFGLAERSRALSPQRPRALLFRRPLLRRLHHDITRYGLLVVEVLRWHRDQLPIHLLSNELILKRLAVVDARGR